jgi:hypothetical protein
MRAFVIEKVRRWQSSFPPDDGDLDWTDAQMLLVPQTDLLIRRRDPSSGELRYRIRVRPDGVVLVGGETAMAVEFSTARNIDAVSPARFGLNHWALRFKQRDEVQRDPSSLWGRIKHFGTRVEMLALGIGYTVTLGDEAEDWRQRIGLMGDAIIEERLGKVVGPACSSCPWQVACWSEDEPEDAAGI